MDTTKIALTMTGAVSLGSFEAGVLTELLWALEQHSNQGKKYELDVITGASAGAMTAGLVANLVMNDFSRRENLYRAWVEMVTIDNLLIDPPDNAFLSTTSVRKIGDQCLSPYVPGGQAPFAPGMMRLTLTLSNLNGVDRLLTMASGPRFVSTFFDDRKTFRLVDDPDPPADAGPNAPRSVRQQQTWDLVREFAIASGSFPLAFPPLPLDRALQEYDLFETIVADRGFAARPTYVDGGTFNNQPIGEAVRLAREADDGRSGQPRKYLFVNASASNSAFEDQEDMTATAGRPQTLARRLADIIFNESRTSDWLRTVLINDQISWRDQFLGALIEIINGAKVADPPALEGRLEALGRSIVEDSRKQADMRVQSQSFEDLFNRSRRRYKDRLDAANIDGPHRRLILEQIVFLLDHISDLDERKAIEIHSLSAETRLAGEQLAGFAGFFKKEYRQYNFRRGRTLARKHLPTILGDYPQEVGPAEFQQYDIKPEWAGFPDEPLTETPVEPRRKLRDQMVERAEELVNDWFKSGSWVADFLERQTIGRAVGHLVRSRLNALLELDS